jgi:hypothetical protein
LVERQAKERVLARTDVRFTRRELRAICGMSDAAIRVHLDRLITMEYVRTVAGRNGLRFEYELLFDGDLERSAPQMIGLIDAGSLATTTATLQGREADLAPRLHVARTDPAVALQGAESAENAGVKPLAMMPWPMMPKRRLYRSLRRKGVASVVRARRRLQNLLS